jgi:drug/metabolite transporter (DMT)-like permease
VKNWHYYLICGLTGIVIPNTNMYYAAAHLPTGILAVIVNTVPIIAYPLALYARVESFNPIRLMGVIFAIVGLMLIILPGASLPTKAMVPWAMSALLTPLSFALCAIYIARNQPLSGDSLSHAGGTLIAATLVLTPFVLLTKQFYGFHFPLQMPDYVILLEILLSSIGYVLFFQLVKIAGPVFYSLVDTIVALTGLFWGYVIFHETLNAWTTSAVIFILSALVLVTSVKYRLMTRETNLC